MASSKPSSAERYSFYQPPEKLSARKRFLLFFWNRERGTVFGRGAGSWVKIIFFYVVFYACLAAFFSVSLIIFFLFVDHIEPRWQLDDGIIGPSPGLGFRPMPDYSMSSTLIWYKHGKAGNWQPWVNRLENYLEPYRSSKQFGQSFSSCDWEYKPKNMVCSFDIESLGKNCTYNKAFGFEEGHPCILIKINKLFNWEPVPYTPDRIHNDMPEELKSKILASDPTEPMVWISCDGENAADKDNIGPIVYTPQQGVPTFYYPYINTANYLTPFVMVEFLKPAPGTLINVECRAWAHNIQYNRQTRQGSVHFELLID